MRKFLLGSVLLACSMCFGQTTSSTSLANATATGAGAIQSNAAPYAQAYTWTVTFQTAGPTAQTTNLEGTIDGTTWFTLDTSTAIAAGGEMRHVVNKPVNAIRCNLAAYTQGSNAGVTCIILTTRY